MWADPFIMMPPSVQSGTTVRAAREIRGRARAVRLETQKLKRFAAWQVRLRIAGGSDVLPARDIVEQLVEGPLCAKCIATRMHVTLFSVEHAISEMRRAFVIDTTQPCEGCGKKKSITLRNLRSS